MPIDAHIHMLLDSQDWRAAIARHKNGPDLPYIHAILRRYQEQGYTYLRDGGDRWGVGAAARALAPEYGITYRTPLAPLCQLGHYGSFIGTTYETLKDYARLVSTLRARGGDFVKIMISGLMDFHRYGVLTEEGLPPAQIHELIHIAHEEGFAVMAHANGARTVEAAAAAGADSIEHGAYLDDAALHAMVENDTVWVPTLSTIANLRGKGRFPEAEVEKILTSALENVDYFATLHGKLAPGTDAGAWSVPHATASEHALLKRYDLAPGTQTIQHKF